MTTLRNLFRQPWPNTTTTPPLTRPEIAALVAASTRRHEQGVRS